MNVYRKMLVRLLEESKGKTSEKVDFRELLKNEGFLPSYDDIHTHLSRQGWITDTGRGDVVSITHWGVKEAEKSQTGNIGGGKELQKSATKLKAEIKELLVMAEEFASEQSEENYKQVREKFETINGELDKIKANF